ncbi:hypothetical protein [Paraburkholderia sp.]|uniref:hypothetical protein n=1 Tax=Paraburkholderia sp. TaxID=1926495 RepID=UPI003D6F5FBE
MISYRVEETVLLGALILLLMTSFQDRVLVIGGMFLVGALALDDLSETAFLRAMLDNTIKQTITEPVAYIMDLSQ